MKKSTFKTYTAIVRFFHSEWDKAIFYSYLIDKHSTDFDCNALEDLGSLGKGWFQATFFEVQQQLSLNPQKQRWLVKELTKAGLIETARTGEDKIRFFRFTEKHLARIQEILGKM